MGQLAELGGSVHPNRAIETSKDGSRIFMRNEGAVFYLKKGTKKYSSIHRALGESHKFSKSIKLKVNAKSLVIVSYED